MQAVSIKKKIVETSAAFRTAAIKPFEIGKTKFHSPQPTVNARQSERAKLIIETPEKLSIVEDNPQYEEYQTSPSTSSEFKPQTSTLPTGQAGPKTETTKVSALDKIRNQFKEKGGNEKGNENHPLKDDSLQKAWSEYVQKLKEAKNSAALSFEMAMLRIKDDNSFEAVTADNIQKQFIEQERNKLFTFLQERLQNRLLQFNVIIEETTEGKPKIEISLTAKEQFIKMAEQYPMVKELKERLRLELDY